jgi:hypothetical protein|nr:MAG TPA: hypothetical protein [Caudoviricetes sp.]
MNFSSYTVTVDFEGLELPLPNNYRYITRDSNGFIQGWRNKPTDTEFGMSGGGEELPITFGHQSSNEELKTVIRKYRRRRGNTGLIAITGAVE